MTETESSEISDRLSTKQVLGSAWMLLLDNGQTIIAGLALYTGRALLIAAAVIFVTVRSPNSLAITLIVLLSMALVSTLDGTVVLLKLARMEKIELLDIADISLAIRWIVGNLCYTAMVITGLALFALPGLYLIYVWPLYNFAIIDGVTPKAAFIRSVQMVRTDLKPLFLTWLVFSLPGWLCSSPWVQGLDLALECALTLAWGLIYSRSAAPSREQKNG